MKYPKHNFDWRKEGIHDGEGILVGCNKRLEGWLPWWYHNYSKYNSLPIAVINFGMSKEILGWCRSMNWEIIDINISLNDLSKREPGIDYLAKSFGEHFRDICLSFFSKPFALLQSPFYHTLWIDVDCLVLGNVAGAFDFIQEPHFVAMGIEAEKGKGSTLGKVHTLIPDAVNYNTGVIAYRHGSELVKRWASELVEREGDFLGDQDLFCRMLCDLEIEIPRLPKKYNWIIEKMGVNKDVIILHFSGKMKLLGIELVKDFYSGLF